MKIIQPVSIWVNGITDNATIFNLSCIYDNIYNSATFSYQLFNENIVTISTGELTLNEPNYATDWNTNDAAYNWAATQLGLTITGEYIPPITE